MADKNYDKPPPPAHLTEEMQTFWVAVFDRIRLQAFQVHLLQKACEAHDRAEMARRVLEKDGLTFQDRFGQPRSRPEANIEAVSRAQFQKLLGDCGVHDSFFVHQRKRGS